MKLKVYKEIASILRDYSYKGKILDFKGLKEILLLVMDDKGLHDYVSNFSIKDEYVPNGGRTFNGALGAYFPLDGNVELYSKQYNKSINSEIADYDFDEEESVLCTNSRIQAILLHELNHADQQRMYYEHDGKLLDPYLYLLLDPGLLNDPMERSIKDVNVGFLKRNMIINKANKRYSELYDLNTAERLAEINAQDETVRILSCIPTSVAKKIRHYCTYKYYNTLLRGYDEDGYKEPYTCPTDQFLKEIKFPNLFEKFDCYDSNPKKFRRNLLRVLDAKTRIEYGLPATDEELFNIDDMRDLEIRKVLR